MLEDLKVLLVDDDPKNLIALESLLNGEGRVLVSASSGFDALRRLLEDDFALILMDVRMPGMDGFETAELIRARERTSSTPIIFLTAAAGDFPMVRGYSLGAVDYIVKPVDPDILRFKVSVFVDLYRRTVEVREQAEEIAQTNAFLSSVLEGVTEHAIAALDREGRVLVWNQGAHRIYGHTAEAMIGQPAATLWADHSRVPDTATLLQAVDRDGGVEIEAEHVRANGRRFPAIVHIAQRTDEADGPAGYVFVSRDLTSHRQAEEARALLVAERAARAAAEDAQRRLQQVLEVFPQAVLVADAGGHLLMANAVSQTLLGTVGIGADLSSVLELYKPDRERCSPSAFPLARVLTSGSPVQGEQFIVRSATGEEVSVLLSAAAVTDADGSVFAGVMTMQDITSLKELDQQKDDFLAAIAHDLKNPLTIVMGNAQLIQRRARQVTESDESTAELLQSTVRATRRATAIVNELLDVARAQMERPLPLDRIRFDLAALTQDVVGELARTTERHDIRLVASETFGSWDRDRLHRVISNLVENAVKYSPLGGRVDVCIKPLSAGGGGEWVELTVKDRGVGIPPEELPLIFEKFYRASNVSGRISGSGIGLAAALQVVEAHGGSINIDSEPNNGTTVTMRLPATTDQR